MSNIKRKLIKMIPRKMRVLTREIIFHDVTVHKEYISINLILKKFYHFNLKEKLEIFLTNGELERRLEYSLEENILSIKLYHRMLNYARGNSSINIRFNNKQMLVKKSTDIHNKNSFISNNKYFNVITNGALILEELLTNYSFQNASLNAESIKIGYEEIVFNFSNNINLNHYKLAFLYSNRIVILDNIGSVNEVKSIDFKDVTMGKARVFLLKKFDLIPVKLIVDEINMTTQNHKLKFLNDNEELYVYIENHELEMTDVSAELIGDIVRIELEYDERLKINDFIIEDVISGKEQIFSVENTGISRFATNIPLDVLLNDFSRKKIKLVTAAANQLTLQPDVSQLQKLGFGQRLTISYDNENIKIWFYKRRDNALGFKVTRPRMKRQITWIENFSLEGFIEGKENFTDCESYLIFEDRYSKEYFTLLVDEEFNIDLTLLDLNSIKSKNKTILDIFVAMIHRDGKIIRKEKIKYKFSDYKKDNYYGSYSEYDTDGNAHYHLITTTPFDNLKIESFSIPKEVVIPDETNVKDFNTWLVGERYDTAQDNGYAFYKYLRENTNVNAYYTIESNAPDYGKIKSDPHVLAFGSPEHFEISFKAGVLLGTHDLENLLPYKPARGFFNYEDTVKVFLQHGVLGRKRVEYHKKYYDLPFDLFIVSSEPEKYDVVMRKLGYEDEDVAITGLARFDSLPRDNKTKDILLMPTWRDWINTDEAFLTSKYFHNYNGLIHNERLIKILEDNDVQLNFYPHYRAQMYFNDEILNPSSNINFIQLGTRTVQELLIDHSLLITDYSSVSFDFTLMDKPVIYYHFDVRKFFRQGKLRPLYQTFIGEIARTEDDLVDLIEQQIKLNFQSEQPDISGIFKYQDHHNSERIYNSVIDKINSTEE